MSINGIGPNSNNSIYKTKSTLDLKGGVKKAEYAPVSTPVDFDKQKRITTPCRAELKNESGEVRFYSITTANKFALYSKDDTLLYEKANTPYGSTIDTVFSKDGVKLYTIERLPLGVLIKKTFDENGNLKRKVEFSSDDIISCVDYIDNDIPKEVRKKLPKYLYHISCSNYLDGIQQKGLRKSYDPGIIANGDKACFLISEHDLLNTWTNLSNNSSSFSDKSLLVQLLQHCNVFFDDNLVLFRIPTDSLDINKLKIRDQEDVMDPFPMLHQLSKEESDDYFLVKNYLDNFGIMQNDNFGTKNIVNSIFLPDFQKRTQEGISLDKIDELSNKPLEYYYTDVIQPENIEYIGDIKLPDNDRFSCFDIEAEKAAKRLIQDCILP